MALSRPKKEVDEKMLDALIGKGSVTEMPATPTPDLKAPAKEEPVDNSKLIFVQLRIDPQTLQEIDRNVKSRPGKLSRHTWIMEAIAEKLTRIQE